MLQVDVDLVGPEQRDRVDACRTGPSGRCGKWIVVGVRFNRPKDDPPARPVLTVERGDLHVVYLGRQQAVRQHHRTIDQAPAVFPLR